MRKLKLQVQMSIDGYMGGPNGEMDWTTWNWDDLLKKYTQDLTDPVGTILLGRKMAGGFIDHWRNVANDPANEMYAAGKKFTDTHKVVFSKTLTQSEWPNTELATGDITDEVNELKQQEGGDIIVYGGSGFVSSLIKANLIDEYHLFVNPAAVGKGLTIFGQLEGNRKMTLVKATPFECGIVVLHYRPE